MAGESSLRRVLDTGVPELLAAVDAGSVLVPAAAVVVWSWARSRRSAGAASRAERESLPCRRSRAEGLPALRVSREPSHPKSSNGASSALDAL